MKRTLYLAVPMALALLSLSALAWNTPWLLNSAGPLSTSHQQLQGRCLHCHAPLRGTPDRKCVACHKRVDFSPSTAALHQRSRGTLCASCHILHRGDAGARFDHGALSDHSPQRCDACHSPPDDPQHPSATRCEDCHQTARWSGASLDHNQWFRFDRHHPDHCQDCHPTDSSSYSCEGCHRPRAIAREHREEGIRDTARCASCHRSGDEHEASRPRRGRGQPRHRQAVEHEGWDHDH